MSQRFLSGNPTTQLNHPSWVVTNYPGRGNTLIENPITVYKCILGLAVKAIRYMPACPRKEFWMSTTMLRLLIAGALFVHGAGHTLGIFMPARSWLLPNISEPTLRIVNNILWILTAVGFLLTCLGFLGVVVPGALWRPLAVVFAFVSLFGLFIFWGTWPVSNVIGALSMNAVVLMTQLWLRWPPTELFGT